MTGTSVRRPRSTPAPLSAAEMRSIRAVGTDQSVPAANVSALPDRPVFSSPRLVRFGGPPKPHIATTGWAARGRWAERRMLG